MTSWKQEYGSFRKGSSQSLICEMVSHCRKGLVELNMAFLCNGILYKYPTIKSHEVKYFTDREKCSLYTKGKKQVSKLHLRHDPKYICIHTYVHSHKIQIHVYCFLSRQKDYKYILLLCTFFAFQIIKHSIPSGKKKKSCILLTS